MSVRGAWALIALLASAPLPARADWFCSPPQVDREPKARLFTTLGDNYFIAGANAKFRFSFKFDLLPNDGPCGLYFGYTQHSLWDVWDFANSLPLGDTTYNPQLFFMYGIRDLGNLTELPLPGAVRFLWGRLGIDHVSDGLSGAASRGWQRIFASARFGYWFKPDDTVYLMLEPKVWVPWTEKRNGEGGGNPDIVSYVGYGELTGEIGLHSSYENGTWQDLNLSVLLRKGTVGSRGTVEVNLRYRPPWRVTTVSFYGQAFFGYDETILRYNQRTTAFRAGIAFDDRVSWNTGAKAP